MDTASYGRLVPHGLRGVVIFYSVKTLIADKLSRVISTIITTEFQQIGSISVLAILLVIGIRLIGKLLKTAVWEDDKVDNVESILLELEGLLQAIVVLVLASLVVTQMILLYTASQLSAIQTIVMATILLIFVFAVSHRYGIRGG